MHRKSIALVMILLVLAGCTKEKNKPKVEQPAEPQHSEEIITAMRLILRDSASGEKTTYSFSDPDGPGGNPAFYGPGASPGSSDQSDSIVVFKTNNTYFGEVILLNETATPVDTISNEVREEGDEHMLFYSHGKNTIIHNATPYQVRLHGSEIDIRYTDLDEGNPPRSIGLSTRIRTAGSAPKHPLTITLKHQPGSKNGTYAPGETDLEVTFKAVVN